MSDDERDTPLKHRGPERAAPYPLSRLAAPISLVDAAREIELADRWIASTSNAKLELIARQMRALRAEAEAVLQRARENAELHRAEARFARHPGQIYHLYERAEGQRYWSLLSPAEWGERPPHRFVGSYRLEVDQSWTPLAHVEERERERAPIESWLKGALEDK